MKNQKIIIAILILLSTTILYAQGEKLGSEFQVNTYISQDQVWPSIATNSDGSFIIVWSSYSQIQRSCYEIFGQKFDANGNKEGGEFQISPSNKNSKRFPSIAAAPNGSFIVVWESELDHGAGVEIYGQRLDVNRNKTVNK